MTNDHHPESWVEIDPSAIRSNLRSLQAALRQRHLLLDVSADAHGHGVEHIVSVVEQESPKLWYRVRTPEEADVLRRHTAAPILTPHYVDYERELYGNDAAFLFEEADRSPGRRVRPSQIILRIDIDVHLQSVEEAVERVVEYGRRGIKILGVRLGYSPIHSGHSSQETFNRCSEFSRSLRRRCPSVSYYIGGIPLAQFDPLASDIGVAEVRAELYSVAAEPINGGPVLRATKSVKTRVRAVSDSYMTIPVGYADGMRRAQVGKPVLVHGKPAPILEVWMNETFCDIRDIPQTVRVGDEAVIVGKQHGAEITISDLTDGTSTTPNELLMFLGDRFEKLLVGTAESE